MHGSKKKQHWICQAFQSKAWLWVWLTQEDIEVRCIMNYSRTDVIVILKILSQLCLHCLGLKRFYFCKFQSIEDIVFFKTINWNYVDLSIDWPICFLIDYEFDSRNFNYRCFPGKFMNGFIFLNSQWIAREGNNLVVSEAKLSRPYCSILFLFLK